DVRAVERERVAAALALDDVAAVAGIPLEGVVTAAEERGVGAAVPVAVVVAVAAAERVVARAAVDRQLRDVREPVLARDPVVAGAAGDDEALDRRADA